MLLLYKLFDIIISPIKYRQEHLYPVFLVSVDTTDLRLFVSLISISRFRCSDALNTRVKDFVLFEYFAAETRPSGRKALALHDLKESFFGIDDYRVVGYAVL